MSSQDSAYGELGVCSIYIPWCLHCPTECRQWFLVQSADTWVWRDCCASPILQPAICGKDPQMSPCQGSSYSRCISSLKRRLPLACLHRIKLSGRSVRECLAVSLLCCVSMLPRVPCIFMGEFRVPKHTTYSHGMRRSGVLWDPHSNAFEDKHAVPHRQELEEHANEGH